MTSRVNGATRLVYEWLQDDEGAFEEVCRYKAEAKADAPTIPTDPVGYLATSIQQFVGEAFGQLGEETLVTKMFTWAYEQVDWKEMARWVMSNDDRWPVVEVGPSEVDS